MAVRVPAGMAGDESSGCHLGGNCLATRGCLGAAEGFGADAVGLWWLLTLQNQSPGQAIRDAITALQEEGVGHTGHFPPR